MRRLPFWWYIAGGWYVDRDFINEFPGAEDRAERIGAYFPRSFSTIKACGTVFKRKRQDDPDWAARVFPSSTALHPVPPVVSPSEDVAPSCVDEAGASSALPAPSESADSDDDGASSLKPDYLDPCQNPTTPAAWFLRRHGFLRMRLLPHDVERLQSLLLAL